MVCLANTLLIPAAPGVVDGYVTSSSNCVVNKYCDCISSPRIYSLSDQYVSIPAVCDVIVVPNCARP